MRKRSFIDADGAKEVYPLIPKGKKIKTVSQIGLSLRIIRSLETDLLRK